MKDERETRSNDEKEEREMVLVVKEKGKIGKKVFDFCIKE